MLDLDGGRFWSAGALLPLFFPARRAAFSRIALLRKNQFTRNSSPWPRETRRRATALQTQAGPRADRSKDRPLQEGLANDARAGMDAEAVAAARDAVGKHDASAGRQRRGAGGTSASNRNGRSAEGNWRGRQRPDVLRIGAPIERLIAKLDVHVPRRAHEIDARRAEGRCYVRFREIKKP